MLTVYFSISLEFNSVPDLSHTDQLLILACCGCLVLLCFLLERLPASRYGEQKLVACSTHHSTRDAEAKAIGLQVGYVFDDSKLNLLNYLNVQARKAQIKKICAALKKAFPLIRLRLRICSGISQNGALCRVGCRKASTVSGRQSEPASKISSRRRHKTRRAARHRPSAVHEAPLAEGPGLQEVFNAVVIENQQPPQQQQLIQQMAPPEPEENHNQNQDTPPPPPPPPPPLPPPPQPPPPPPLPPPPQPPPQQQPVELAPVPIELKFQCPAGQKVELNLSVTNIRV